MTGERLAERNSDVPIAIVPCSTNSWQEQAVFAGRRMERTIGSEHAHYYTADNAEAPAVFCECGSTAFQLRCDYRGLIAGCVRCGKEGVVFDAS